MRLPVMFRGTAVRTRKRGVIVDSPTGRGAPGKATIFKFRLHTEVDLVKGTTLTIRGHFVANGDGTYTVTMAGVSYILSPLFK